MRDKIEKQKREVIGKKYDFMAAGHLCLDIIPRFPGEGYENIGDVLLPGKLVNMKEAGVSTGGPVSNTGINLITLGNSVCFCACVGDDVFGNVTADLLRKSGNAKGIKVLENVSSSYTVVLAPPGIDRIFLHNPGTNNVFTSDDLDSEVIAQCRHFHFGYPPLMEKMYCDGGRELEKIFKIAKTAGAITSCDMTLPDPSSPSGKVPWREILERILPYIDIFVPSIEETFYMLYPDKFMEMKRKYGNRELIDYLDPAHYSGIADEILMMGAKIMTLKSGHRGFYIRTAGSERLKELSSSITIDIGNWSGRELWAPAFEVKDFGSATGSGDSSIAGLLSAFIRGIDLEPAIKYATCCGWQNCRVLDAVSGIHSWEETTGFIENRMPLIDAHITAEGWKWSEHFSLFAGPKDRSIGLGGKRCD